MNDSACDENLGLPVVVTTGHYRGVFFGFCRDLDARPLVLERMRNVLYWSRNQRGFVGLAVTGPVAGSRVGPAVRRARLVGEISSILECSEEAVRRFEAGPWSE